MPPRRVPVPLGPPLTQDQCPLLSLPAELRNHIYELVLTVEPGRSGDVRLYKFDHRTTPKTTKHSVLELLGSCLIYQEAAGIFLSENNIKVQYRDLVNGRSYGSFLDTTSQKRLDGLRHLRVLCATHRHSDNVTAFQFEEVTMACKRLRKLRFLDTLGFTLGEGVRLSVWLESIRIEGPFLKHAISNLKTIRSLRFEIPDDLLEADRGTLKAELDELVAMLPSRKVEEKKGSCEYA